MVQDRLKCGEAICNFKDRSQQKQARAAVQVSASHGWWNTVKHTRVTQGTEHSKVTQRAHPNKRQLWDATDGQDLDVLQDLLLIYFYCQE